MLLKFCENKNFKHGLSLIEVLVAVGVLALMASLTAGVVSNTAKAKNKVLGVSERYRQIRKAMNIISQNLQGAYVSLHENCEDPTIRTVFKSDGDRLDFNSFTNYKSALDSNESDQLEVSLFLKEEDSEDALTSKNGQLLKALMIRKSKQLDLDPEKGGQEKVLLSGVQSLSFKYYNPQEERWEDEWDNEDQEFLERLPRFVEVKLEAVNSVGELKTFTVKNRIMMERAIFIGGLNYNKCIR